MTYAVFEGLAIMLTLVAAGTMTLIGFRMRMGHRERMARLESSSHEVGKDAVIESLQSQVDALSEEVAELNERVDFTERLLTQGRHADAEKPGVTTPV